MKKLIFLFAVSIITSCSIEEPTTKLKLVSIDEVITPSSFTYREIDSITVTYTLPNTCHYFYDLYYQYRDTTRVIAIKAIEDLEASCTESSVQKTYTFAVFPSQKEDYVFKFWKGDDANGDALFEEVIIPVN